MGHDIPIGFIIYGIGLIVAFALTLYAGWMGWEAIRDARRNIKVGDLLRMGDECRRITTINDTTSLTIESPFGGDEASSGGAYISTHRP